jgi:4-hydroxybenzoate polyprenyltransferase
MITAYISILRPSQWLKNLMLFFPPFLAGRVLLPDIVPRGLPVFCAFCLASSAGYIFNDLLDLTRDIHHPKKRLRPLPSGAVSTRAAALLSALLLGAGLSLASLISFRVFVLLLGYSVVSLSYSLVLKNIPVIDLFCISAGFLIRLKAGGVLFQIPISAWLFVTVFLLAMFLSTGKRLSESRLLGDAAGDHRTSLARYPEGFLAGALYMTGCSVLITYTLYSLNKPRLIFSIPLCLFGLLRYILRVSSGKSGDPTESLLKDRVLFVVGLLWVMMVGWSLYL